MHGSFVYFGRSVPVRDGQFSSVRYLEIQSGRVAGKLEKKGNC